MTHQNATIENDLGHLAENAESLVKDTCASVSEQLAQASEGLEVLRKQGQRFYRLAQDKGSAGGQFINQEFQDHSFRYVALAAGLGVLFGCLVVSRLSSRQCSCK